MVRSYAPGFIFTTSLPPSIAAGVRTSIAIQVENLQDRRLQQINTIKLKEMLVQRGIPVIGNPSHIVPVLVGDAEKAKQASDMLLGEFGIYVQSINFPTVSKGEERLRITVGLFLLSYQLLSMTWFQSKSADSWPYAVSDKSPRRIVGKCMAKVGTELHTRLESSRWSGRSWYRRQDRR
jgi:hypothetical protein